MDKAMVATVLWQVGAFGKEASGPPEQLVGLAGLSLGAVGLLCALLAIKAGFIGMAVWFHAWWPHAGERVHQMYQWRGAKCFWLGAINTVVGLFVAALMIASGTLTLIGLLLITALLALATTGYAAAYLNLGLQLISPAGSQSKVRTVVLGGIVTELSFLVPVLGQILSLGVLFRGLGAAVLALMAWRRDTRQTAPASPPATPSSESEVPPPA
jgi:hypothetical protein